MKGTVKRWLDGRGYGFIQPENSENDVFVHHSGLISAYELATGQEVEFEMEDTPRGPRATNVKIL
jgi:CspA family cold shock protein